MLLKNILPALSLFLSSVAASNVLDLTPSNFDDEVFGGTPSLVEFFAPWCGHCKTLAPVYEELADSYKAFGSKVKIAKVDADEHKDLSKRFGVSGFPTIKWFDGKSKEPQEFSGSRDLDGLQKFVTEKSGVRPKRALKIPSEVKMLNDQTFNSAIGGDKGVFVAFTAPWCGHCKTLAPIWEKLGRAYALDKDVVTIAKVDAEASAKVASEHEITSYPTIKYFPAGSKSALPYIGGRDEGSFIGYVNEQTGLRRVIGGGLDVGAGTIAALDAIVSKATGGADLADIQAQVKEAAKGMKDKYAKYYVKVLDKLSQNAGYIAKESSRLEGMLEQGGLDPSKHDDLTSRLNILKKFGIGEGGRDEL